MSPHPGWFEQAPDDWAAAAKEAIGQLGDLRAAALLALTGAMQNIIVLAADGQPLRPAILYSDGRAAERFCEFSLRMQSLGAAARVGNQIDHLMCSAKWEWLAAEAPSIVRDTAILHTGAKDYIGYLLTGRHATDATSASATGLMNLASRDWDPEILGELKISREQLPRIIAADAILGKVSAAAAHRFGLPSGLPVLNGTGDAGAATVGAGIELPNEAYVYLGTSGWVARVAAEHDKRTPLTIYTLSHPNPGLLIEIAPILSAGDAITWVQEICDEAPLAEEAGDSIPPMFLPYLKGERSPFHDPFVRGAFLGLDRSHGRFALQKAVFEGVALAIRHNLVELGKSEGALTALGGGAMNRPWMRILADITAIPIRVHSAPMVATAFGAGLLGARTLGQRLPPVGFSEHFQPREGSSERAAETFRRYKAASDFLRSWR